MPMGTESAMFLDRNYYEVGPTAPGRERIGPRAHTNAAAHRLIAHIRGADRQL